MPWFWIVVAGVVVGIAWPYRRALALWIAAFLLTAGAGAVVLSTHRARKGTPPGGVAVQPDAGVPPCVPPIERGALIAEPDEATQASAWEATYGGEGG